MNDLARADLDWLRAAVDGAERQLLSITRKGWRFPPRSGLRAIAYRDVLRQYRITCIQLSLKESGPVRGKPDRDHCWRRCTHGGNPIEPLVGVAIVGHYLGNPR